MRIAIGIDTRGDALRPAILTLLAQLGHEAAEVNVGSEEGIEYPEIAVSVAQSICEGNADRGILMGRSGMSLCVVANKFRGIRAAICHDELTAEMGRRRLDLNVLCLPIDLVSVAQAEQIVSTWLATPFDDGRHADRIRRIEAIEREAASYAIRTSENQR